MNIALFLAGTLINVFYSRRSLRDTRKHGFHRFFVFESLLILVLLNAEVWFDDPLSFRQIVSWTLLCLSLALAVHGFVLLHKLGRPEGNFEQTTHLVEEGAYRYIRHPLYASLLALGWGAFLKDISLLSALTVLVLTSFAVLTARTEEYENVQRFGAEYEAYMGRTRRFIPFLF
jgi:protein-S-isoprenylcysteine O-methyltransferase Ste14